MNLTGTIKSMSKEFKMYILTTDDYSRMIIFLLQQGKDQTEDSDSGSAEEIKRLLHCKKVNLSSS